MNMFSSGEIWEDFVQSTTGAAPFPVGMGGQGKYIIWDV